MPVPVLEQLGSVKGGASFLQVAQPGAAAAAVDASQQVIVLDDGRGGRNPVPIPYPPPGAHGFHSAELSAFASAAEDFAPSCLFIEFGRFTLECLFVCLRMHNTYAFGIAKCRAVLQQLAADRRHHRQHHRRPDVLQCRLASPPHRRDDFRPDAKRSQRPAGRGRAPRHHQLIQRERRLVMRGLLQT